VLRHTCVRISCIRCSGSSFACAAFELERAGLVSHVCIGSVMGRSMGSNVCAGALALDDDDVSAALRRELGVSGMGSRSGGTCVTEEDESVVTWCIVLSYGVTSSSSVFLTLSRRPKSTHMQSIHRCLTAILRHLRFRRIGPPTTHVTAAPPTFETLADHGIWPSTKRRHQECNSTGVYPKELINY